MRKIGPYFLLFLLLIAIIFIVGVRYGTKVEQANKAINYVLSLTPTMPPASPTPVKYLTYSNKVCGVQFLYPSYLKPTGESSKSAILKQNSAISLKISCDKSDDLTKILKDPNIATAELTLKGRKLQGKEQNGLLLFQLKNPYDGTSINVNITGELYPLFENTLQYLP